MGFQAIELLLIFITTLRKGFDPRVSYNTTLRSDAVAQTMFVYKYKYKKKKDNNILIIIKLKSLYIIIYFGLTLL